MSASLLRKELRDQRPYLVLSVFLLGVEAVDVAFGHPDLQPLSGNFRGLLDFSATIELLLAFAVGTGLLVREEDDGTLRFLDGLPVTRWTLFASKVAVALGVLLLFPTGRVGLYALEHLASRSSLDHALHPGLLATAWALNVHVVFFGLAAGMALGYLRSLAWACAAGLAALARLAGEEIPRLLLVNPLELGNARIVGTDWRLSPEALGVQLALAAGLCLLAGLAYTGARGHRLAGFAQAMRRPVWSAAVAVLTLGLAAGVASLYSEGKQRKGGSDVEVVPGAEFREPAPATLATTHYLFSYPAFRAAKVRELAARADEGYQIVAALLPSADARPVDVDLSGSQENTAGTAFWGRVRMRPDAEDPLEVLVHETAHVLAARILGERGARDLGHMPVLNEGLAEWVAYRTPGSTRRKQADERIAGALFARHEALFPQLVDFEQFTRERDSDLKYSLGAALVRALVDRYGEAAPRRVLETMARPDFPTDLHGLELWQAAFQLSGYDLGAVVDAYDRLLAGWAAEHQAEIAALPRVRGAVEPGRTRLQIRLTADKPLAAGAELWVRLRPTEDAPRAKYRRYVAQGGVVSVARERVAHDTVCFQPGLRDRDAVLYEAWQCEPIEWAEEDPPEPGEEAPDDAP